MKISTKGRYALRLMLDMAIHKDEGAIKLKDIASRQEISEKYLEQIIATLNKQGLVVSQRGASGGYYLSKSPKEYTVGEIIRAIEGSLAPVECLSTPTNPCNRKANCVTLKIWEELNDAINDVVDKYTLADLASMSQENIEFVI